MKTRALRADGNWPLACIHPGGISIAVIPMYIFPHSKTGTQEVELIHKILCGRRDLFEDLIAPHLPPLSRIVRAKIGSRPEVEDIVQQTALKALTHLEQFRFDASFRTWLIRI